MIRYTVYANGKEIMTNVDSKKVSEVLGILYINVQKAALSGSKINLEISFDRKDVDTEMTLDDRFKNYYGIDNYRQWVQMNRRYGKRVTV